MEVGQPAGPADLTLRRLPPLTAPPPPPPGPTQPLPPRLPSPLSQPGREVGQPAGPADLTLDRFLQLTALLRVIRTMRKPEQLGLGGTPEPHQRRLHTVERGARHEADAEAGPNTAGGRGGARAAGHSGSTG